MSCLVSCDGPPSGVHHDDNKNKSESYVWLLMPWVVLSIYIIYGLDIVIMTPHHMGAHHPMHNAKFTFRILESNIYCSYFITPLHLPIIPNAIRLSPLFLLLFSFFLVFLEYLPNNFDNDIYIYIYFRYKIFFNFFFIKENIIIYVWIIYETLW